MTDENKVERISTENFCDVTNGNKSVTRLKPRLRCRGDLHRLSRHTVRFLFSDCLIWLTTDVVVNKEESFVLLGTTLFFFLFLDNTKKICLILSV